MKNLVLEEINRTCGILAKIYIINKTLTKAISCKYDMYTNKYTLIVNGEVLICTKDLARLNLAIEAFVNGCIAVKENNK